MRIGRHWIGDISGCDVNILRDESALNLLFETALIRVGAQILEHRSHVFEGEGGVTGVFLLAESHASYHSYPEHRYLAVDFFTCGSCDPAVAADVIIRALNPGVVSTRILQRSVLQNHGPIPVSDRSGTKINQEVIR
ncbi:MAG: adenosylmethionine decarboxylase [Salinarimonas sp.]